MHYCSYLGQPLPSKACKILNLDVSGDLTIIPSLHITFVCATPPTGLSAKTDFLGNAQSGQISFVVRFFSFAIREVVVFLASSLS